MNAIRNLLDAMSAGSFKTENGQRLYFPNGVMGSGYVIPDGETEARIRAALRKFYGWFFAFILFGIPLANVVFSPDSLWDTIVMASVALIVMAVVMHFFLSRLVAGLEKTSSRMGFREALAGQAKATPRWFTILQVAVAVLMLLGGILMLMDATGGGEIAQSIGVVTFGFALLALSLYAMTIRKKL